MNLRPVLASIFAATCLTGCATFSDQEISQMHQRGVSSAVVGKMQEGHVLSPGDVIELTRRGVPDEFIIRQIDETGLDYVLSRNDFKRLHDAHVSHAVMDELIAASEDFASSHHNGPHAVYGAYPTYAYDPYYYGPAPYYYPYYGVSVGVGDCHYWGHGHHWH
jgi:hypothetical protein